MSVLPTSTSNSTSSSTSSNSNAISGFANLTTGDFMQMLIAELQNQDPTQPMTNQDLLTQLSTMSQLQSTTELDTALQDNTTNQQLSIAAQFIGATVTGTDATNASVSGVVDQAFLQNGTAYVGVGSSVVPLTSITSVTPTQVAAQ